MSYHENAAINDAVLTIINDGDGSQCEGFNYARRKAAAEFGLFEYRAAVRAYSRYRHMHYGSRHLTRPEVIEAASYLQEYYREHVKECA